MSSRPSASKPQLEASEPVDIHDVIAWLERHANPAVREGMARFAIPSDRAFGISVGTLQREAKRLGRTHGLAQRLWDSGHYEARLMAAFIDEPGLVTPTQMDRWAKQFDNSAVCDTVCMHLFDRTPHAHRKVLQWAARRDEFVKRAAFVLLAALVLHREMRPRAGTEKMRCAS
jgi:3-methyladenine DNA glycosylase AlkD